MIFSFLLLRLLSERLDDARILDPTTLPDDVMLLDDYLRFLPGPPNDMSGAAGFGIIETECFHCIIYFLVCC